MSAEHSILDFARKTLRLSANYAKPIYTKPLPQKVLRTHSNVGHNGQCTLSHSDVLFCVYFVHSYTDICSYAIGTTIFLLVNLGYNESGSHRHFAMSTLTACSM